MKKIIALLITTAALFSLTACVFTVPDNVDVPDYTDKSQAIVTDEPAATEAPDPKNDYDNRDLGGSGYVLERDGVLYYGAEGYGGTKLFLHRFDGASGVSSVLCGKEGCMHLGYECGACGSYAPQYYDGRIYFVQYYSVATLHVAHAIFSMNLDGSDVKLVRMLKGSDTSVADNEDTGHFIMHRGKMYAYTDSANVPDDSMALKGTVVLMELGKNDGEHTVLFEREYAVGGFAEVFMYDGFAYVLVCARNDTVKVGEPEKTVIELCRVDLITGEDRLVFSVGDAPAKLYRNCFVDRDGTIWFAAAADVSMDDLDPEGNYTIYYKSYQNGYFASPISGAAKIYRSDRGGFELVAAMDDGEIIYEVPILSKNVCGGFTRDEDGTGHIWLRDFSGKTIYKGEVDMDFSAEFGEDAKIFPECGCFGDGNGICIRFVAQTLDPDRLTVHEWFLVRYALTPNGLSKTVLRYGK